MSAADLVALMHRFATAIDTRDWAAYRSVFTDEFHLDYSSWNPASIGTWRADDWVARAQRLFPGLTHSRHDLTNLTVTPLDDGSMLVRANVAAHHVIVDDGAADDFVVYGVYHDRCVETAHGWRIADKCLEVQWCTGDASVMDRARARAAGV